MVGNAHRRLRKNLGVLDPKVGHERRHHLHRWQVVGERLDPRAGQLPVVAIGGTGAGCGERIPVMTVNGLGQPANHLDDLGMCDLSGSDPAVGQLSDRAVDVVGIEAHGVVHEAAVADFDDHQELDDDWSIGIVDVDPTHTGERETRSPNRDGLNLHAQAARRKFERLKQVILPR